MTDAKNPQLWDATLEQLSNRLQAMSNGRVWDVSSMKCTRGHPITLGVTGPECRLCLIPVDRAFAYPFDGA